MSLRYKGGVISATPPTTTGGESGTATGVWTLEQQMQINAAGNWPIQPLPKYIEDVFSTYVYTGNGSTQTITNGIDLSGKGGLVWIKCRTIAYNNVLFDTLRGGNYRINSNTADAQGDGATSYGYISAFNSNGFSVAAGSSGAQHVNYNNAGFVSWTFREQPKFFDVVTWTGNGVSGRTISHSLASTPGCIIIKQTSGTEAWDVYHRSLWVSGGAPNYGPYVRLNEAVASFAGGERVLAVGSTTFTIGNNDAINSNGATYVAYLFAHDAGGFGANGTDSVISCGSFTTDSGEASTTTLGWEPQWLLIKKTSAAQDWYLADNIRGLNVVGQDDVFLYPNLSDTEGNNNRIGINATGFTTSAFGASSTFIYVAIRRGPMRTPTSATTVFTPVVRTGTNGTTSYTGLSFSPDLAIGKARANTYSPAPTWTTKLIGTNAQLGSSSTNSETSATDAITGWLNTGYNLGADNSLGNYNFSTTANNYVSWNFGRAPGFFDVVCYTGTGSATTFNHNLGVAPELIIVKARSATGSGNWVVYSSARGATKYLLLNVNSQEATASTIWNDTAATSSVFTVGTSTAVNGSGGTYVAYLFATVAGVSKVGTYTGTGTTQQINCGFTTGARFVLIKRATGTGDWYVWDSARGIVAGNDPYLLLDSTAAEVTNTDYVDTYSAGFEISSTAPTEINDNGSTFIFLAIA